ncbi:MAG: ABC transporter substrate-binding protein [candidate division WS1 bacterium]|nr:ABC transporter substrate-binding protein [candidate division WS1 bacterium]
MRSAIALALACVLGLALVGCPGKGTTPTAGPPNQASEVTVNVGYFPNVTHAPAVLGLAEESGVFRNALAGKARISTKSFNAGPSAMEALHAGALDMCFVGPTPAVNAFAKGGDVVLVANVASGGSLLVAREGVAINSLEDLEGKKVAVPQLGNTQDAILRHLLIRSGIKLADQGGQVTILPVQNPDILALFLREQLDAACVPEPWGARLEQEAKAKVVLDEKALWRNGDYPVTVLVVRKDYLEQHPEVVRAFLTALQQVIDDLAADPTAKVTELNAELKVLTNKELKPSVLSAALRRIQFTTQVNPEALQAMAEMIKEVGIAKAVPDLTGFVDESYLPAAEANGPGEPE